jgi:hypothetical protein
MGRLVVWSTNNQLRVRLRAILCMPLVLAQLGLAHNLVPPPKRLPLLFEGYHNGQEASWCQNHV